MYMLQSSDIKCLKITNLKNTLTLKPYHGIILIWIDSL